MKLLGFIVLSFVVLSLEAQNVGISSTAITPDGSAGLEIRYTDKGVLIPRVALTSNTDAVTIATPATSLFVYNLGTGGLSPAGYYYNSGTSAAPNWVRMATGTSLDDAWKLLGNAGTNPATNFLGTTDNQELSIRTNNTEYFRITTVGQIVPINTGRSLFIGENAGASDDGSDNRNIFIGPDAGTDCNTGSNNIAMGRLSFANSTTGFYNIAQGELSMRYATIGCDGNVALGHNAMSGLAAYNNSIYNVSVGAYSLRRINGGDYNVGVGRDAGQDITTGSYNTVIGYNADIGVGAFTNATAIGYNATATSSNQMRLGNASITSLYCQGAYAATTTNRANVYVSTTGQIMRSTHNGACNEFDDGFESNFGIWSNVSSADADWTIHSGATGSSNTGPSSANEGAQYIYCETSTPRVAGDVFSLQTSVKTCDAPSISFDYHMYFNTATDGTLLLEVSNDNGMTWTNLWTQTGNQGNVWHNDLTVPLAAYQNAFIILRFRFTIGSLGTVYQYDCALDDIKLIDISDTYPSGDGSGSSWELLGNAGTTSGTNFLGTIDAQDLDIRTNNIIHTRITTKGQIETINTGNSVFIGEQAGENDDLSSNNNVFVGHQSGFSNTTGYYNSANGYQALYSNTTGLRNTANGYQSLYHNTTGQQNTANGYMTLYSNTTGINNNASGMYALYHNTTGTRNTASGYRSLFSNTTGNYNISSGYYSLYANTTGNNNTATGYQSLYNNTTGYSNVAIGTHSLHSNTEKSNLVAIGDSALFNNGTGATMSYHATANTAVGSKALYSNTTGYYNTASGSYSLYSNTTGYYNIATGLYSLYSNTTGRGNIANGYQAMYNHQTGNYNFAGGSQAMFYSRTSNDYNIAIGNAMHGTSNYSNTDYNIALGYSALNNINGGDYNIALGYQALYYKTTGNYNIGIGYYACRGGATSTQNVGIGRYALYQNQGSNNTGVGYAAGAGVSSPTYSYCTYLGYDADFSVTGAYTNAMALGYSATVTASNRVRVGNTSVTRIGGQVGWSNLSDGRIKDNVQEDVVGLDFIMNLRPVTFNYNKDKQDQILGKTDSSEYAEKYDIEKIKFTGFIAQEVEEAALNANYDFSGVKKPAHDNDLYGLTYSEFVVPLVKATQEQQVIIESQEQKIEDQDQRINALEKQIQDMQVVLEQLQSGN